MWFFRCNFPWCLTKHAVSGSTSIFSKHHITRMFGIARQYLSIFCLALNIAWNIVVDSGKLLLCRSIKACFYWLMCTTEYALYKKKVQMKRIQLIETWNTALIFVWFITLLCVRVCYFIIYFCKHRTTHTFLIYIYIRLKSPGSFRLENGLFMHSSANFSFKCLPFLRLKFSSETFDDDRMLDIYDKVE